MQLFKSVEKKAKCIGMCQFGVCLHDSNTNFIFRVSQKSRDLKMNTGVWDARIPEHDPFEIEVTVCEMHPGLTSEEALIGTRIIVTMAVLCQI